MAFPTPGPWVMKKGRHDDYRIIDKDGGIVAETRPEGNVNSSGNEEENARLIAAAPDLLAACEALHARLFHEQGGQNDSPWAVPLHVLSLAIRKARS